MSIVQLEKDSTTYSYNITALSDSAKAQSLLNASTQTTLSGLQNTAGILDQRIATLNKTLEDQRQTTQDSLKDIRQTINHVSDLLEGIRIDLARSGRK